MSTMLFRILQLAILAFAFSCCQTYPTEDVVQIAKKPRIYPDYSEVTIPPNIAPLTFRINENAKSYYVKICSGTGFDIKIKSSDGIIRIPIKAWKNMLEGQKGNEIEIVVFVQTGNSNWEQFESIKLQVSDKPIDPYLVYRLLYPGYEGWHEISIIQRNLENFREYSVLENQMVDYNCVNCHSFCNNNPDKGLLHVRGKLGGTYFFDGKNVEKTNLKTKGMDAGAVYPSWHPNGRFVAFSSNKVTQSFHAKAPNNIEVYDLSSSLVLYDSQTNMMHPVQNTDTTGYMETFPTWSPDGAYIYYCRTKQVDKYFDIKEVKYDLVRRQFNQNTIEFGAEEMVFNANNIGKSVSFPRISPNGKFLVFTLFDYGTFSIWHKEADLYLLDLQKGTVEIMRLNSNETESYHSWSSNGSWLVFSSKRGDGLSARPYISYIDENGKAAKPFVLPQKDPDLYKRMLKTFNIPEFIKDKVKIDSRQLSRAAEGKSIQVKEWKTR